MTSYIDLLPQADLPLNQEQYLHDFHSTLKWRQGRLFVRLTQQDKRVYLPATDNNQWLAECLSYSPVELVRVDLALGEAGLMLWANASEKANKRVFLRIPSECGLLKIQRLLSWRIKRIIDWIAAALLLLLISPLMLVIAVLMQVYMPGPMFFQQWRVGQRGKLFRIIKFRTMVVNAEKLHHQVMADQTGLHKREDDPRITPLGRWMRKYSVDELPQLFNVLRGEMSLVGPRPWALYDALRLSPELQKRLNALPGITGAWQVSARSNLLDINAVTECDLEYLYNWSLWRDLKILLLTVPKVILGVGAC